MRQNQVNRYYSSTTSVKYHNIESNTKIIRRAVVTSLPKAKKNPVSHHYHGLDSETCEGQHCHSHRYVGPTRTHRSTWRGRGQTYSSGRTFKALKKRESAEENPHIIADDCLMVNVKLKGSASCPSTKTTLYNTLSNNSCAVII